MVLWYCQVHKNNGVTVVKKSYKFNFWVAQVNFNWNYPLTHLETKFWSAWDHLQILFLILSEFQQINKFLFSLKLLRAIEVNSVKFV